MGLIISDDILQINNTEITARSTATGFAKKNVMNFWHLKCRFRADDLTKSDTNYLIKFDLGSAQTVVGVMLNDINFDKACIYGHASDLGTDWSTASYDSGDISVSLDNIVNRYKAYIPLTAFNYQWLAVAVPSAASVVGTYTTKWEVGEVAILDSVTTLAKTMSYGYQRQASKAFRDIELPYGGVERVALGDNLRWAGNTIFGNRTKTQENELWTVNAMDNAKPIVFYENDGDTSKVYVCTKGDYVGTIIANDAVIGNTITFREII